MTRLWRAWASTRCPQPWLVRAVDWDEGRREDGWGWRVSDGLVVTDGGWGVTDGGWGRLRGDRRRLGVDHLVRQPLVGDGCLGLTTSRPITIPVPHVLRMRLHICGSSRVGGAGGPVRQPHSLGLSHARPPALCSLSGMWTVVQYTHRGMRGGSYLADGTSRTPVCTSRLSRLQFHLGGGGGHPTPLQKPPPPLKGHPPFLYLGGVGRSKSFDCPN